MKRLEYNLKSDVLFKMFWTRNKDLLKRLIASLLEIDLSSISELIIENPEIPPREVKKKFCRLDIAMDIDGKKINLELQVHDEKNYIDRSLFYLTSIFANALDAGQNYSLLPPAIMINILGFSQFPQKTKHHHIYKFLDTDDYDALTDKLELHFFELDKFAKKTLEQTEQNLWLKLINCETEEELTEIAQEGGDVMKKAVRGLRSIAMTRKFRNLETMRRNRKINEAFAIDGERQHWQGIVAEQGSKLAEKDSKLAEKDSKLAEQEAIIAKLKEELNKKS